MSSVCSVVVLKKRCHNLCYSSDEDFSKRITPPSQQPKGISHSNDSLCRIATVSKRHLDARIMFSVLKLTSKGRIPINSLPLSLVDPTLRLDL